MVMMFMGKQFLSGLFDCMGCDCARIRVLGNVVGNMASHVLFGPHSLCALK